jgi:hypothetical protein
MIKEKRGGKLSKKEEPTGYKRLITPPGTFSYQLHEELKPFPDDVDQVCNDAGVGKPSRALLKAVAASQPGEKGVYEISCTWKSFEALESITGYRNTALRGARIELVNAGLLASLPLPWPLPGASTHTGLNYLNLCRFRRVKKQPVWDFYAIQNGEMECGANKYRCLRKVAVAERRYIPSRNDGKCRRGMTINHLFLILNLNIIKEEEKENSPKAENFPVSSYELSRMSTDSSSPNTPDSTESDDSTESENRTESQESNTDSKNDVGGDDWKALKSGEISESSPAGAGGAVIRYRELEGVPDVSDTYEMNSAADKLTDEQVQELMREFDDKEHESLAREYVRWFLALHWSMNPKGQIEDYDSMLNRGLMMFRNGSMDKIKSETTDEMEKRNLWAIKRLKAIIGAFPIFKEYLAVRFGGHDNIIKNGRIIKDGAWIVYKALEALKSEVAPKKNYEAGTLAGLAKFLHKRWNHLPGAGDQSEPRYRAEVAVDIPKLKPAELINVARKQFATKNIGKAKASELDRPFNDKELEAAIDRTARLLLAVTWKWSAKDKIWNGGMLRNVKRAFRNQPILSTVAMETDASTEDWNDLNVAASEHVQQLVKGYPMLPDVIEHRFNGRDRDPKTDGGPWKIDVSTAQYTLTALEYFKMVAQGKAKRSPDWKYVERDIHIKYCAQAEVDEGKTRFIDWGCGTCANAEDSHNMFRCRIKEGGKSHLVALADIDKCRGHKPTVQAQPAPQPGASTPF